MGNSPMGAESGLHIHIQYTQNFESKIHIVYVRVYNMAYKLNTVTWLICDQLIRDSLLNKFR